MPSFSCQIHRENDVMIRIPLFESAALPEDKTYVVVLRFTTGFTPIVQDGDVNGTSTSVHFKHSGEVEEARKAYTEKLAELGLHPDSMDFTEEVKETFDAKKSADMLLGKE